MTKIAIYICDRIDDHLPKQCSAWPTVGDELLQIDSSLTMTEYDVFRNEYPSNQDFDAFIIPGARDSALDIKQKPWIQTLSTHIKSLYDAKKTLIGICFGHQVISHALGGVVSNQVAGMHIGLDQVSLNTPRPTFLKGVSTLKAACIHEDIVTKLPKQAKILGHSTHDPHIFYHINDQVLSMQFHPDFSPKTMQQLFTYVPSIQSTPNHQQKQSCQPSDYKKILQLILDFIKL